MSCSDDKACSVAAVGAAARSSDPAVLLRREEVLVMDKPSGWVVHRGWARDGPVLVDVVRGLADVSSVHPIGRLDRGASGVVLFALRREAARTLHECLERRAVAKRYLALVRGQAPEGGTIDHPLPRREGGPRVSASSTFRRLAIAETEPRTVSLVEVVPHSGRLHQIRRHLKHIDHPLIGDANYGKGQLNRALAERYGLRRLALHAHVVRFPDPASREVAVVHAPTPPDLAEPLEAMGVDLAEVAAAISAPFELPSPH